MSLITCLGLGAQERRPPNPRAGLEPSTFFQSTILKSTAGGAFGPAAFSIGRKEETEGDDYVDTTVSVRFDERRRGRRRPFSHSFVVAFAKNVEALSEWRLREGTMIIEGGQQDGNAPPGWDRLELTFGYREQVDAASTKRTPAGLPKRASCVAELANLFPNVPLLGIRTRSVELRFGRDRPIALGEVEITGEGYRRVFATVEFAMARFCRRPDSPFAGVRLAKGEVPIEGRDGAVFTFELAVKVPESRRPENVKVP